jgi:DNA modification methylase
MSKLIPEGGIRVTDERKKQKGSKIYTSSDMNPIDLSMLRNGDVETENDFIEGAEPFTSIETSVSDKGKYDERNQLNDLTGREWVYFQNSVMITGYSTVSDDNLGHEIRKIHPSPKPPQLMRDLILFFTKKGGKVLDPFAGVGGSLIGASICDAERHAVGVELSSQYVDAYKRVCRKYQVKEQTMICDDARNILRHPEISETLFDLILTDPPYFDMLNREQNGAKKKLYGTNDPTPFSASPLDIGNLPRSEFFEALTNIVELSVSRLKPKKYLVVFCKDMQPDKASGELNLLHAEVARSLSVIPSISFVGMKIWHDQSNRLFPFGYPYKLVLNQMHQYILIFHKDT